MPPTPDETAMAIVNSQRDALKDIATELSIIRATQQESAISTTKLEEKVSYLANNESRIRELELQMSNMLNSQSAKMPAVTKITVVSLILLILINAPGALRNTQNIISPPQVVVTTPTAPATP